MKAYWKDIFRTIKLEKKRFFSILLITFLGVTMFAGLSAGCRDLRASADRFYDEQKFSAFLVQHGVMERYIDFVLHEKDADMYQFLTKECGLKKEWRDLREAERYRINAANVLDDKDKLCEIHAFQRDARNQPYVPGSSIKGALRTAWLALASAFCVW